MLQTVVGQSGMYYHYKLNGKNCSLSVKNDIAEAASKKWRNTLVGWQTMMIADITKVDSSSIVFTGCRSF